MPLEINNKPLSEMEEFDLKYELLRMRKNQEEIIAHIKKQEIEKKPTVSITEASKKLNVTSATVRKFFYEGKIKGIQDGKRSKIILDRKSFEDFLKQYRN